MHFERFQCKSSSIQIYDYFKASEKANPIIDKSIILTLALNRIMEYKKQVDQIFLPTNEETAKLSFVSICRTQNSVSTSPVSQSRLYL